ncbi:dihydroorotase [Arcobacter sp. FWKO B]|uniref:dihydroorotase n=1 Tax=Arcobacter sp. FWKO B TaxID=2593672 RepID=UPI002B1BD037
MSKTFTIKNPLDMHLHLRDNDMLNLVAPLTSKTFSGAIIMPNLVPPVTTKEAVVAYKQRILQACKGDSFEPYMTLFFQNYTKEFLTDVKEDILAIKLYPAGITTNSETGVSSMDVETLRPTLEAMSELGIPLCIHGETNGFVMDREAEFMPIYASIASAFPNLKIIMEHITTKAAVDMLDIYPNLYATITLHHLLITLDDVAGGMLKPHLFCKPIAKRDEDRAALLNVALGAHPKVCFGSDSAPHPKHKKESCGCAAGVFTAPIALQVLTELFEKHNCLDNLQKFISDNAVRIYGINPPQKTITLEKVDFKVPQNYQNETEIVVPMYADEVIKWSLVN